jgi:hypothetical protein
VNDWRGTPIKKGSIIVYPGRQSSAMWMVEAEVLEVTTVEHWNTSIPALLVQPLRAGFFGRTNKKPVRITAIERVTVLPKCQEEKWLMEDEAVVDALIGKGDS